MLFTRISAGVAIAFLGGVRALAAVVAIATMSAAISVVMI
jgi:hypothetical protein